MPHALLFRLTALLCGALCGILLLAPGLIIWLFSLSPDPSALVLARRAGVLFLGLCLIYWHLRDTPHLDVRRVLFLAGLASMGAMALLGLVEFSQGRVGPGIFLAISVEAALAVAYGHSLLRR